MSPFRHQVSRIGLRPFLGFALLLVLVTWLFSRTQGVSNQTHHDYLQSLRALQRADVELNASILAIQSRLMKSYDPAIGYLGEIRQRSDDMARIPAMLPQEYQQRLLGQVEELVLAQRRKAEDIDHFLRAHSILRNSQYYLATLADELDGHASLQSSPIYRRVLRRLAAYPQSMSAAGSSFMEDLQQLRQMRLGNAQADEGLARLVDHAEQIVSNGLSVAQYVQLIQSAPTLGQLDEVLRSYAEGYELIQRRASYYRLALYAVSLILGLYLILALIRIERNRRALSKAHRDLHVRYEAQQRAESDLRLYATVFTNAREGMTITDANSRIVAVNPAFTEITGYSAEEVIGETPALLNSGRQSDTFYEAMWEELSRNGQWQGEIWNARKDGSIYPEWLSIAAVLGNNAQTTHYIGVFSDISERKLHEERIQHLAHHDVLTGLPNRALLEARIAEGVSLSQRHGRIMGVLFIDLDRFKNINDTLGHAVGDQLLIQAAQRGRALLRENDTLARLGGDEFVAVLPDLENRQAAGLLARKLIAEWCRSYHLAGHELTVSASIGIALFPEDGHAVSDLLRKADAAMYRAKEEGRNTFRYFSSEISRASLGELLLENDLHTALERGELEMYFEPKVDAQSGQLLAAEALMRWTHHERGAIPPSLFIPLAERGGLIHLFGEWALRQVCGYLRHWLDQGLPVRPVAVNLSAQQFTQQDIPAMVADLLAEFELPPHLLELELTESVLMRNTEQAVAELSRLRNMGIKVAIDDFGVGYSSLGYLKQFPVHALKLDRAFVWGIEQEGDSGSLASAIIAMAHELGLVVVAEGVETPVQRRYLVAHGCDILQGYLFGKPQSAEAFRRLLKGEPAGELVCAL